MKALLWGIIGLMFLNSAQTEQMPTAVGASPFHTVSTPVNPSSPTTTKPVRNVGFTSGYRSYGGPARKVMAGRLAIVARRPGIRGRRAKRRLGNMNARYGN